MYAILSPQVERLSLGFEPVTSWSQGSNFTIVPKLTLNKISSIKIKKSPNFSLNNIMFLFTQ